MHDTEFALKTTPPRLPRTAIERARLERIWEAIGDRTVVTVLAPAGFGKTVLLVHWRKRWLAEGAQVAWLSADRNDDPAHFHLALLHAIRTASGRIALNTSANESVLRIDQGIETLTGLLAEIAALGRRTVLIVDDAERLPAASRASLAYLLSNAPPNLHVAIGTRTPIDLRTAELSAKGLSAVLSADDLRLQPEETLAILHHRFDDRLSLDDGMRLHAATEGWPIGLQLAIATIESERDPSAAVRSLSGRRGDIERYFVESLLASLSPPLRDFLVRIAILDRMNASMCAAVTGCTRASDRLRKLLCDTPILIGAELQGWYRAHPLVRDFLLGRFERLPRAEQRALHRRACDWFAREERFPEAATHAFAAGEETLASAYAVKSLWTLRTQGKFAEAQAWLQRIPPAQIAGDTHLRLLAAWADALGERNAEAFRIASAILDDPATAPATQFVAALVASSATGYSDHIGLVPELFARWSDYPADVTEPVCELAWRNAMAHLRMHAGRTDEARRILAVLPAGVRADSAMLALSYRTMLLGMTHLWDGDAWKTQAVLEPALQQAERAAGRRSLVASMFAAVLAPALHDLDQPEAAQALLADRLDVIEHTSFPDAIMLAYRTLVRIARSRGEERRALSLLDNLGMLAERRHLPRLAAQALAERTRMHAFRGNAQAASRAARELDALAPEFDRRELLPYRPQYRLAAAIAHAYAALARHDHPAALRQLATAESCASGLQRHGGLLTVSVLRAVCARQCNDADATALLVQAQALAPAGAVLHAVGEVHPLALQMATSLHRATAGLRAVQGPAQTGGTHVVAQSSTPAIAARGPLTPKESSVLALLDKGMSNKQIARVLDIGDETVKWHVKNLFLKLSAGTRKHAVDRARLLGLVGS
ncbi:MAG: AAA family ATPase [Proteobacteria bacterium]|nr:AAA family ATPase [Pseudomonadota bacterium]